VQNAMSAVGQEQTQPRMLSHLGQAASIEVGMLVTVLADFETKPPPVNLFYPAGRFLPIKVRAFLDFAASRPKAQLARSVAGQNQ